MVFVFQQPGSSPLLDAVEDCAANSESMGGMFAFATKAGAELLLNLPAVEAMIGRGGRVELTVGLDAITNGETLLYLRERIAEANGNLDVKAFLHPWPGTFHPKFMWFVRGDEVTIITGSGNLTPSGLGQQASATPNGNWEAFIVQRLDKESSKHFLAAIQKWLAQQATDGLLLEVDQERALARGTANSRVKYVRQQRNDDTDPPLGPQPGATRPKPAPPAPWPAPPGGAQPRSARPTTVAGVQAPQKAPATKSARPTATTGVDTFIRELSRNRPGQADIGQAGLSFFGFSGDAASTVLLQYVGLNNQLEPPVEKQLFVNASDNYRVEMGQIAKLGYVVGPQSERMILVAVRLDARTYRYTIVPVKDASYAQLSTFLSAQSTKATGKMREAFTDSSALAKSWPLGPISLFPVTVISADADQ